jgi:hypothetical protein
MWWTHTWSICVVFDIVSFSWTFSSSSSSSSSCHGAFNHHLHVFYRHHRLLALDAKVHASQSKAITSDDMPQVHLIANALALSVAEGVGLDERKCETVYNEIDGSNQILMLRYSLFVDADAQQAFGRPAATEVRLHFFPNAAETYIHNHRSNFISTCLFGGYTHYIWQINADHDQGGVHDECGRDSKGALTARVEHPGSCSVLEVYRHVVGNTYFLHNQAYHTARVTPEDGATLTMFYKVSHRLSTVSRVLCHVFQHSGMRAFVCVCVCCVCVCVLCVCVCVV